jgi:hypothetical protein
MREDQRLKKPTTTPPQDDSMGSHDEPVSPLRTPRVTRRNTADTLAVLTAIPTAAPVDEMNVGGDYDAGSDNAGRHDVDESGDVVVPVEEDTRRVETMVEMLGEAEIDKEKEVGVLLTRSTKEREQKKYELTKPTRLITEARRTE